MGMILGLSATDDDTIEKLLADPPLIWKFLAPDEPEMYEEARKAKNGGGLFARLFGRKSTAPPIKTEIPRPVEEIDLDKSWHGIHYLLTKTAWEGEPPLNFLILGGEEVGNIEVGYGTARAFRSDDVRRIHEALQHIDDETLRSRFDPADMISLEIYPEIWNRDPADDDTFGYCAAYFDDLKNLIARTTEANLGLVISLS